MKYQFQTLPRGRTLPIVPFAFAQLPRLELFGLVDSGAGAIRVDSQWAEQLGLDLSVSTSETFSAANNEFAGRVAEVPLRLGKYKYNFTAPVTFVDNWGFGFQLLGWRGFFDRFVVRFDAANANVTLTPSPRHQSSWPAERSDPPPVAPGQ